MSHSDPFERLNREFYATNPSTYFRDRLQMLILRAANPNLIDDNISEETVWGTLRVLARDEPDESVEAAVEREAAHTRFVVTESQILLHHVAEAFLRMYLAHEAQSECPWLTIAALKGPGQFRDELDELARSSWPKDRMNAAGWVFLGDVPDEPSADWIAHRDAAVRLLRILAQTVNGDSQLYNGVKHGFTALGGTGSLHFLPADTDQPPPELTEDLLNREAWLGADGVNVAYLEREGTRNKGVWYHKTKWVNPEKSAYLTQLATIQMEALWTVARCRYLGEALPGGGVHLVTDEGIDQLRTFPRSGSVESWRWQVATETARPG
ncbi:hypothetical protein [Nocardioides sp. SYSU D00038]|uniref:hypothetical protein n=1 Tax=Nocardioides sp. SYSU D00038 TaxID=2812554 RepID=UPI001966E0F2|nr:hypothetical protein [Nocardioides sp. SYSU D00038]